MLSTFSKAVLLLALGATPTLASDWFCIADTTTGALTEVSEAEAEPYLTTQNAKGREWYIENWPLTIGASSFEKYGLPRILSPNKLTYYNHIEGVPVFYETGSTPDDLIYVLEQSRNCEMQPYMRKLN